MQHLLPDPDPVPPLLPLLLHWLNLSAQIPAAFSLFDRCCCCCCLLAACSYLSHNLQNMPNRTPSCPPLPLPLPLPLSRLLFPKQVQKTVSSAPSRVAVVPPERERPLIKEVVDWLERAFCLRYVKLPVVKLRFISVLLLLLLLLLPLLYYFCALFFFGVFFVGRVCSTDHYLLCQAKYASVYAV